VTAEVINIRDYQSQAAVDRAKKALEGHLNQQMVEIATLAFPSVFGVSDGIDGLYLSPEKDPA
jgi:hypothetical protein